MVHFEKLPDSAMAAIVNKYLIQLQDRTAVQGIQLHLPAELAAGLGKSCGGKGGARQIRRLVQEQVEGPLATFLLGCGRKPARIRARWDGGTVSFQS